MRLATIQTPSGPRAAVFHENGYIDLHATDPALPPSVRQFLEGGPEIRKAAEQAVHKAGAVKVDAAKVRLLPPVPDPRKIICLGLNYRDHAMETGAAIPKEPVLFSKYATALIGPADAIVLPPVSQEVDYEAEMVIVVGKRGRPKSAEEARDYRGRLHGRSRCLGPRLAAEKGSEAVDGRQDLRHLRPDRPAPGDGRRGAGPAQPVDSRCGSTARRCRTATPSK